MNSIKSDITLLKDFLKNWDSIPSEKIKFERLGGLSNLIYKVSAPESKARPSKVILRKFGQTGIDRDRENYIFQELSKNGLGPQCYGNNEELRVEEFFESRELKNIEFSRISIKKNIAKNLGRLHRVEMKELEKTPMFKDFLEKKTFVEEIIEKVQKTKFSETERAMLDELETLLDNEEIEFLTNLLPKDEKSIVFSHNDLHLRNMLKLKENGKLVFIDYEYGGYNYRGFDIANLFNEAIIDYDCDEAPCFKIKKEQFATENELKEFIKYYLFFYKFDQEDYDESQILHDDQYFNKILEQNTDLEDFQKEIDEIYEEVRVCYLFSHYYWIIWSILTSKKDGFKFDYIQFAYDRFKLYQELKADLTRRKN